MAEWSNAAVLKTVELARVPGVRIPLSPPRKERCQSGRMGRSRKPLYSFEYRGFESLSLRNKKSEATLHSFCFSETSPNARIRKKFLKNKKKTQRSEFLFCCKDARGSGRDLQSLSKNEIVMLLVESLFLQPFPPCSDSRQSNEFQCHRVPSCGTRSSDVLQSDEWRCLVAQTSRRS